jgi:hypothetical protein
MEGVYEFFAHDMKDVGVFHKKSMSNVGASSF